MNITYNATHPYPPSTMPCAEKALQGPPPQTNSATQSDNDIINNNDDNTTLPSKVYYTEIKLDKIQKCTPMTPSQKEALQEIVSTYQTSTKFASKMREVEAHQPIGQHLSIRDYLRDNVLQSGWSILELGSGAGIMLQSVRQVYEEQHWELREMVGIEVVPGWVKFAQNYFTDKPDIFEGDFTDFELESPYSTFDFVMLNDVVSFVHPERFGCFFRQLDRLTHANSVVYMHTAAPRTLSRDKSYVENVVHHRSLVAGMAHKGFELITLEYDAGTECRNYQKLPRRVPKPVRKVLCHNGDWGKYTHMVFYKVPEDKRGFQPQQDEYQPVSSGGKKRRNSNNKNSTDALPNEADDEDEDEDDEKDNPSDLAFAGETAPDEYTGAANAEEPPPDQGGAVGEDAVDSPLAAVPGEEGGAGDAVDSPLAAVPGEEAGDAEAALDSPPESGALDSPLAAVPGEETEAALDSPPESGALDSPLAAVPGEETGDAGVALDSPPEGGALDSPLAAVPGEETGDAGVAAVDSPPVSGAVDSPLAAISDEETAGAARAAAALAAAADAAAAMADGSAVAGG